MDRLYLRYARLNYANTTYFRYSFGDLFAIGDYHEMGIALARIAAELILSIIEEGERLLIEFYHQSILDFLNSNNIEYFASVEENQECQKHLGWSGKIKEKFSYVPTHILFSTEDRQVLYQVIIKFWDGHLVFRLSKTKNASLSDEATDIKSEIPEIYFYETGLKSGFIMWESKNHKDLNFITCKDHPDTLKQIIIPIVKKHDLDCDICEEDLSQNEKRILETIKIES
jgi:hypothetical protein